MRWMRSCATSSADLLATAQCRCVFRSPQHFPHFAQSGFLCEARHRGSTYVVLPHRVHPNFTFTSPLLCLDTNRCFANRRRKMTQVYFNCSNADEILIDRRGGGGGGERGGGGRGG